ncbi:UDP-N-acetylglucosamine 2-epimerase [Maribrevibacterium harenarium]|uniref:UDP-N-acetylglucosamine 2-epimerase n=1 Tax=Maribrevibacterium harenarium TaxID=2589817 RepID=UPI0015E2D389|nr:UDP-N-acetylglucosamine 2-epimerase [Maribrevibacterium harenarium]
MTLVVVTTNRAEYGLLYWLLDVLHRADDVDLRLVVAGSHLSHKYGYTIDEITLAPWHIDKTIDYLRDGASDFGSQYALISQQFYPYLQDTHPDLVILLGDRYELLGFANIAVVSGVPIAHISGGEITEGAIDDRVRHGLTKLSDLHFVGSESFRRRVIQMGEAPERVFTVGELGLEHIHHRQTIDLFATEPCQWHESRKPFMLVTFHAETASGADPLMQQNEVLAALETYLDQYNLLMTYPNCDRGGDILIHGLHDFKHRYPDSVHLEASLGFKRYGQALSEAALVIGNSSSGLYEAPAYGTFTVNIGDRQRGRLRGNSVLDTPCDRNQIITTIAAALQLRQANFIIENPYGDGHCADKILTILRRELPRLTGIKPFIDLPDSGIAK